MKRIIILFLVCFSLVGCANVDRPELVSSTRNGNQTTYVYYEQGRYVAYYMKDGVLIRKEIIGK